MRLIPGVNDEYPLTELQLNDVIQPGNVDTFSPTTNASQFKARIGKVRPVKVDLQFKPTQVQGLWKTYLGEIQQRASKDAYDLPFEGFLMDRIIAKAKENIRLKAMFKGIYNAAGTTPASTMDGIIKLISAAKADGSIPNSQIATLGSAISASNAVDMFEKIVDIVPSQYKQADLVCVADPLMIQYYFRDYRSSFGALPYNTVFKKNMIDGTTIELVPEPGLAGTDLVIITPRYNMTWLVDEEAKMDNIIVEKALRNINVILDFNCAPDFGIAGEMWMNDQAVYSS
jgi:hypothetical protein